MSEELVDNKSFFEIFQAKSSCSIYIKNNIDEFGEGAAILDILRNPPKKKYLFI